MKIYRDGNGDLRDKKIEEIFRIDTLILFKLYFGSIQPPKDSD